MHHRGHHAAIHVPRLPTAKHLGSRFEAFHRLRPALNLLRPILALASAILIYGCASTAPEPLDRDLPSNFPNHSVQQILLNVTRAYPDTILAYRAKASLAIRTPDQSGQFSADMRKSAGDSLYVSISPGLGIEAARALVTPDSFYFYDRLKNRLVYGSMDEAAEFLPQPFASKGLSENLLGLISPPADIDWRMQADSAYYYLMAPDDLQTYTVDPAFWRVVRYTARQKDGTLIEQRSFSEFDTFDGHVLPRRVEFNRPLEESRASIYYRSLTLNPGDLSLELGVRDSAERIQASR